jgi:hypothetical protein
MSSLKLNDNVIKTTEEFDSLSILEKRMYIIQNEQENTMWYQRTVAKINLIGFGIGMVIFILYLLFLMTK